MIFSSEEINQVKENQKILTLRRGGCIIQSKIGNIQFGIPPETIKDCFNQEIDVPAYYVLPSRLMNYQIGLTVAELEFPTYFNFFIRKQKTKIICTDKQKDIILKVFQETLIGPQQIDYEDDFIKDFPEQLKPNLLKENAYFKKNPMTGQQLLLLDLFDFYLLDNQNEIIIDSVKIQQINNEWYVSEKQLSFVIDNTIQFASYPEEIYKYTNCQSVCIFNSDGEQQFYPNKKVKRSQTQSFIDLKVSDDQDINRFNDNFEPPVFGLTFLGNSHGFDKDGLTSGIII